MARFPFLGMNVTEAGAQIRSLGDNVLQVIANPFASISKYDSVNAGGLALDESAFCMAHGLGKREAHHRLHSWSGVTVKTLKRFISDGQFASDLTVCRSHNSYGQSFARFNDGLEIDWSPLGFAGWEFRDSLKIRRVDVHWIDLCELGEVLGRFLAAQAYG